MASQNVLLFVPFSKMYLECIIRSGKKSTKFTVVSIVGILNFQMICLNMLQHLHLVVGYLVTLHTLEVSLTRVVTDSRVDVGRSTGDKQVVGWKIFQNYGNSLL